MSNDQFDLSRTFVHLELGARATAIPDFQWTPEFLERYEADHAIDGSEGRLVCITPQLATWTSWERHPAGDEVVVLLAGRVDLIQDLGGTDHVISLQPGQAMVNPAGVWHRSVVHEQGSALFITPGQGTQHRPLA